MTPLTLAQSSTIVDKALEHGRAAKFKPLAIAVLDAGGHLVAFKREDGASILRPQIAQGKAWGTLGMGFGGREFARRVQNNAAFMTSLMVASDGKVVPNAGGVLIRDAEGNILGAAGMSGDTSENDEACVVAGIKAAGLIPDTGDAA
jgi:uncharacterized protein GlcG (DUF336 family)